MANHKWLPCFPLFQDKNGLHPLLQSFSSPSFLLTLLFTCKPQVFFLYLEIIFISEWSHSCDSLNKTISLMILCIMEMSLGKRFEREEGKRKFSLLMVATKKPKFSSVCTTPRGGQKQKQRNYYWISHTKSDILENSWKSSHQCKSFYCKS